MGRHDTYLSAAGTRPPAGRGRRGRRGGLPSLGRSATNRRPLPIRTDADWLDPFSGPRPSFDWADDVDSEEGEIPFQPTIARRQPLHDRSARADLPPAVTPPPRGTFTLPGWSLATNVIYRREPFAHPPHLLITGV